MGLRGLGRWFDERLQLAKPVKAVLAHPVPRQTASWFYVFGSAALALFVLQLVTGILLALTYVPSAGEAWNVLPVLNRDVPAGWFIRALHGWGSNFMVAIVLIHMVQVFLSGAYKYPRELTWVVGVLLLLAPAALSRRQYLSEPVLDRLARDRARVHHAHDALGIDEHRGRDAPQRVALANLPLLIE